jgi:predicted signal transduction protein with EAL and GGDEF domain
MANFPAHGQNCQELLHRADQAMMRAKASGKNSIHLIGQDNAQASGNADVSTEGLP